MALQARSDMELWDRPFQSLLLSVLAVNILSHALNVPWWILLLSAISLVWKIGHLYRGWPLPGKRFIYLTGVVVGGAVIWEYKTAFGHEAATPTLVFLTSLKLLETNRDRDARFVIVTSYFLLMAHLLHSQSLLSTFFMAFDVAIITILMYQLHRADRRLSGAALRPIVRVLVLTIPVWLLLFFVFPRLNLTMLRMNQPQASVGFSEDLAPGSVNQLAQSNDPAFRVKFQSGPQRSTELLYWRGATLYHPDDLTWKPMEESEIRRRGVDIESLAEREADFGDASKQGLSYRIIAEPSVGRTIFTLSRVVKFEPIGSLSYHRPYLTHDDQIRLRNNRSDHISYAATSISENEGGLEILDRESLRITTALPANLSPKVRELIDQLANPETTFRSSPKASLRKLDEWFARNEFRYTLDLSKTPSRTLDEFLFTSRRGFCEHFAGASAVLLRAMGHPTRVVVGYHGGRWNDISKALVVQSRDAHAWVEVWHPSSDQPNRGRWLTYDPTAMIAPLRLRMGGDFFDLDEEQQLAGPGDFDNLRFQRSLSYRMLLRAELAWDYAQMTWTQFLIGYDQSGQQNLLNTLLGGLGIKPSPWMVTMLIVILLTIFLRLVFLWNSRAPKADRLRSEWLLLEKELTRLGYYRSPMDGPLTLRDRVPIAEVSEALDHYIALVYGKPSADPSENKRILRTQVRLLKGARRALRQQRPIQDKTNVQLDR
jgi:protein-glutamine gamma-glutamyltransferase